MSHPSARTGSIRRNRCAAARLLPWGWLSLSALLISSNALAAPHRDQDAIDARDRQTVTLLERLADGRLDEASVLARQLARDHPDLRLAQLLHAELQTLQALDDVRPLDRTLWSDALLDLLLEARTRLSHRKLDQHRLDAAGEEALPALLVQLGKGVSDVLMVDLSRSELLHYRVHSGIPTLANRHYISSASGGFGKNREGDMKTPLGVYRIRGFRPGHTLPDLYGTGALTLDYPNALDRSLGRTGSGIWLHGVPSANASRAPWSSEGCVTMSNAHLDELVAHIDRDATVVVLADRIDWLSSARHAARSATRLSGLPVSPSDTVIEVPRRGSPSHVAVQETLGPESGDDWHFVAIDATARDADDSLAQWTEIVPR